MENPAPVNPDSLLAEPLLVQPTVEAVAVPQTMVSVTAPNNLPAGYVFEAKVGNRTINITVPEGGVAQGQVIVVPMPPEISTSVEIIEAPIGKWKDGLCDCFSLGCFHPSVCCALCCTPIAVAQIMTRLNLTWLGLQGTRATTKNTFKIVLVLFIIYLNISTLGTSKIDLPAKAAPTPLVEMTPMIYHLSKYKKLHPALIVLNLIISLFGLYFFISLCNTRRSVRKHYKIPEGNCGVCEDCCCTAFCGCCAVSQMSRHTGEYEKYGGVCCSDRGLPPNAPLNVV